MKKLLRIFLINIGAIYVITQWTDGIKFDVYAEGVILTGIALGIASFTIRPIIKILLLPITLATAGVFTFIGNVITLYIVDYAVTQFTIEKFYFPGLRSTYLDLPKLDYSGVFAYVAYAISISVFVGIINWLRK